MMTFNTVFTRKLRTFHQKESFTEFLPLKDELVTEIRSAVKEIFDTFGGKDLIKSSGDVYISLQFFGFNNDGLFNRLFQRKGKKPDHR